MRIATITALILLPLAAATAEPLESPSNQNLPALLSPRDYSFGFFPQGWRRDKVDGSAKDLLRFETGYYGFEIDADDIQHPRFGLIDDGMGALNALTAGAARSDSLAPAKLSIEIEKDGKTYRAVRCLAGTRTGGKHGFANGRNPKNPFFYWVLGLQDAFLVRQGILQAIQHP